MQPTTKKTWTPLVHIFFLSTADSRRKRPKIYYSNIYIQQYVTLHSLFYLETALHVSGGTTTHHQERKQLYLQHLVFVTPLLLPASIAAGNSNGVTML